MDENNVKGDNDKKGITLNDLILLKQIVNLASRRGAFSAEEFKDIGDVYSRLDNFINVQLKVLEDSNEVSKGVEEDNKEISKKGEVDNREACI